MSVQTRHIVAYSLALLLSTSCSNMNSTSGNTALGAGLGCAAGAITAKLTGNKAALGCAAGAVVGGTIGYLRARNAEVEEAKHTAEEVKAVPGTTVTPVEMQTVQVTDKETRKTETVSAFKSISVDIPLSQVDTADGKEARRKLEEYARRIANQRGDTIDMTIAEAPAKGAKSVKSSTIETFEASGKGRVRYIQQTDPHVPSNVQRITIEAHNQNQVEV